MTGEARGLAKRPEDLAWLVSMARSQRRRLGRAYLSFGTPIPLRERLTELRSEGVDESQLVERIALDASHRINRVTAVTVTAVVCLAVLGACSDSDSSKAGSVASAVADAPASDTTGGASSAAGSFDCDAIKDTMGGFMVNTQLVVQLGSQADVAQWPTDIGTMPEFA